MCVQLSQGKLQVYNKPTNMNTKFNKLSVCEVGSIHLSGRDEHIKSSKFKVSFKEIPKVGRITGTQIFNKFNFRKEEWKTSHFEGIVKYITGESVPLKNMMLYKSILGVILYLIKYETSNNEIRSSFFKSGRPLRGISSVLKILIDFNFKLNIFRVHSYLRP
jgi:hypothetical protein